MIKKTILSLVIASSLVLTGCTASEEGVNVDGNGSSTDAGSAPTVETLFQLPSSEFLANSPTELDSAVLSELKTIISASWAKSASGYAESLYTTFSEDSFTLYYRSPNSTEPGLTAAIVQGEELEGYTVLLPELYQFYLYSLNSAFESDSISGVAKDSAGNFYLGVTYGGFEDVLEIKVLYYIVVKDNAVTEILHGDSFGDGSLIMKVILDYGVNETYESLFDNAVPSDQLPIGEISEKEVEVEESSEETTQDN